MTTLLDRSDDIITELPSPKSPKLQIQRVLNLGSPRSINKWFNQ